MKRNFPGAHVHRILSYSAIAIIALTSSCCGNLSSPDPSASASLSAMNIASEPTNSRVNINTASVAELERLPGVGRGLAERIVAHREQYGPFRRAEHLMMVRGISDNKFRKIRDLLKVN
jgi:competence protein ComEA